MNLNFRLLEADEIDARVAQITQNSVMLLLYKDARCDMAILDETVGPMNWQRKHCRDNANCTVMIWDDEKNQWIEKEDTGTESNTEKEKGLASDSFKRACTNWGIGRELYTSPTIFFPKDSCNIKAGSDKCYDRFSVSKIEYDGRKIASVEILNENTGALKTFGKKTQAPAQRKPAAKKEQKTEETKENHTQAKKDEAVGVPNAIADMLKARLKEEGISLQWIAEKFNVKSVETISETSIRSLLKEGNWTTMKNNWEREKANK